VPLFSYIEHILVAPLPAPVISDRSAWRAYYFELGAADCTPRMFNLVDLLQRERKELKQQIVAMDTEVDLNGSRLEGNE
jgi:hypothetical protein